MKKKTNKNQNISALESNNILLITKEQKQIHDEKFTSSLKNLQTLSLSHPRHKKKTLYIFDPNNNSIQEVLKFSQPYRSWFIGNSIESDGKIYFCSSIDPLFLVLPYFYENKMSSTLDQVIHDDQYPDSFHLEGLVAEHLLLLIADKRDCRGLVVWKFNEEKTLTWLRKKVSKVAKILEQKALHVSAGAAISSTFVRSINVKEPEENYIRYAHGVVSDYLLPELAEKLLKHLNLLPLEVASKKRKNEELESIDIKKLKKECAEKDICSKYFPEDNKTEKNPKKNPKQAALAKAATGTKSISSFFKKK